MTAIVLLLSRKASFRIFNPRNPSVAETVEENQNSTY